MLKTEIPCAATGLEILQLIPTRSCQINSKQISLIDLTWHIYIICIIGIAWAIWFFVAIVLPVLSGYTLLIIAKLREKNMIF